MNLACLETHSFSLMLAFSGFSKGTMRRLLMTVMSTERCQENSVSVLEWFSAAYAVRRLGVMRSMQISVDLAISADGDMGHDQQFKPQTIWPYNVHLRNSQRPSYHDLKR